MKEREKVIYEQVKDFSSMQLTSEFNQPLKRKLNDDQKI